jgi:hypothetical protein
MSVSYLGFISAPQMEVTYFSKMVVDFAELHGVASKKIEFYIYKCLNKNVLVYSQKWRKMEGY